MLQHLIVALVFIVCLGLVIRRVIRMVTQARRGDARCLTCTETGCPLHHAHTAQASQCSCSEGKKRADIRKNCKKTHP